MYLSISKESDLNYKMYMSYNNIQVERKNGDVMVEDFEDDSKLHVCGNRTSGR